jgi:hypothetical protein
MAEENQTFRELLRAEWERSQPAIQSSLSLARDLSQRYFQSLSLAIWPEQEVEQGEAPVKTFAPEPDASPEPGPETSRLTLSTLADRVAALEARVDRMQREQQEQSRGHGQERGYE